MSQGRPPTDCVGPRTDGVGLLDSQGSEHGDNPTQLRSSTMGPSLGAPVGRG